MATSDRAEKMSLFHTMVGELYRTMFEDKRTEDAVAFQEATLSLLAAGDNPGEAAPDTLAVIYDEIGNRRAQAEQNRRDGNAPLLQLYVGGTRVSSVAPMYECVPKKMVFNVTRETIPSAEGDRLVYRSGGYTWALVAYGHDSLSRVSADGAYESPRAVAEWVKRKALKRQLEAAFRGA